MSTEITETRPLSRFTEEAYLNYSMYVIMDRHCRILATA